MKQGRVRNVHAALLHSVEVTLAKVIAALTGSQNSNGSR